MIHNVYSITCIPNGKVYFGRSQEIEKRWRAHKNMLRRGMHNNTLLQENWSEYGEESFKFEILHTFTDKNEAEQSEQKYIDDDSYDKYNISDASDGGDTYSNNPRKEEISKLKSEVFSGKNNPMYGRPKSDYTIKRIKEANSKPVIIEGVLFPSTTEASKILGIGTTTVNYRLNSNTPRFEEWKYAN